MDVVIDTDPGLGTPDAEPEDALAITLALGSPELDVRAITCVHGNVPLRDGYATATRLLALLEREDVPLAAGHAGPLADREPRPRAVDVILDCARGLVAIGPLTNVAAALLADPSLADRLERVVIMGSAFAVPGNVTPTAEFNFAEDPEAARVVLDAGVRPVLVGLDVCHQTHLPPVRPRTALGAYFEQVAVPWLASDGPYLYDSLAVAGAIRPDLLTVESAFVRIEDDGTSVARRADDGGNALVATGVDVEAFDALFAERVLSRF